MAVAPPAFLAPKLAFSKARQVGEKTQSGILSWIKPGQTGLLYHSLGGAKWDKTGSSRPEYSPLTFPKRAKIMFGQKHFWAQFWQSHAVGGYNGLAGPPPPPLAKRSLLRGSGTRFSRFEEWEAP